MQCQDSWLQGIQYFRAIAILEVVIFHVVGIGAVIPNPLLIAVVLRAFTSFGVPHFIFISGVVLYNKYQTGFSISKFYRRRFSAIVPPYLVWSTFYFAVYYIVPTLYTYFLHRPSVHGSNQTVVTLAITYGQQLVLGYQFLWFIPILIQLYLLYPLLKNTYNYSGTQKSRIYILSFFLVVQVGYVALLTAFPSQSVDLYLGVLFLSYVFYFVFGFFIAQHYEVMKQRLAKISLKIISLVVLTSTLCYAFIFYHAVLVSPALHDYVWLEVVTAPFYCLLLIIFYLKISTFWGEPHGRFLQYLEKIGEDSFGIYLVHWFFVGTYATLLLLLGLNPHNLILYPILFFLTLISSYVVVEAIYRLPFSNIIIGSRRKKATS